MDFFFWHLVLLKFCSRSKCLTCLTLVPALLSRKSRGGLIWSRERLNGADPLTNSLAVRHESQVVRSIEIMIQITSLVQLITNPE